MRLILCFITAYFVGAFNLACASGMGAAEWKYLQFETIDGEMISVRIVDSSSVAINMKTRECAAYFPKVPVGEGLYLWKVEYLFDRDARGLFHLLNIPSITAEPGKQIHKSNAIYIRDCKIERIESTIEDVLPA
ncbi:hypothetical protein [Thermomonas carbonis]|uniref:Uncharacterized protein n=1 Tax=Thermomonas carbonis TaxID=1463158 RepID=A0A7G9SNG4_9GAMM|nr:hypothetical protein [Thermomonas carbonis]QNN69389.1 hypothetical protein H9L16_11990 [Thermomonas carbonis]GHC13232.1 hypothetical protein GCM10010080_30880 [Thermomonas carbonis]